MNPFKKFVRAGVKAVFWQAPKLRGIRSLIFRTAPPGSLIYTEQGDCRFLVSAGDMVISRSVFIGKDREVEKLKQALALIDTAPSTLFDIGANIGTICIPAIKRGLFKRAVAVEPEPRNFQILAANIAINGLNNFIEAHNVALSDEPGSLEFNLSPNNFGDHRVVHDDERVGDAAREVIEVKADTFDSLFSARDDAMIFVDTQGHEAFVLAGAVHALAAKPPVVLEFWPHGMGDSYRQLKEVLLGAGYTRFCKLTDDAKLQPLTKDAIDALYRQIQGPNAFCDVLFL